MQKLIKCRSSVSLYHTVTSHGWVKLAPWNWDTANNELSRPERLVTGKIVLIKVSQSNVRGLNIRIDAEQLSQMELENIESIVKYWLSIDWDPEPVILATTTLDPHIALFIKNGGGRFLRSSTFYEDFLKTICTINTNWASTKRMVSSLVNQLGGGAFPTPLKVIRYGETYLRQELRLGFRARVISELSHVLLNQGIVDDQGKLIETNLKFEDLIRLRGIGKYSAAHLKVLCHDFSRVPVDSEVAKYLKDHYDIEPEEIQQFFAAWGLYKFLGYKLTRNMADADWNKCG